MKSEEEFLPIAPIQEVIENEEKDQERSRGHWRESSRLIWESGGLWREGTAGHYAAPLEVEEVNARTVSPSRHFPDRYGSHGKVKAWQDGTWAISHATRPVTCL